MDDKNNPSPKIVVHEPDVSEDELDTALRLAGASLKACRDVCQQKQLDHSVVVTALAIAMVQAAKDHGMPLAQLLNIVRTLSEENVPENN